MARVEVPRAPGQTSRRGRCEIEAVAKGPTQGLGQGDFGPAADPDGNAGGDRRISKDPVLERGLVTYDPMRQQAWKPRSTAGRNSDRKKIPSQGGIDAVDAVRRGVEHTASQARDVVGNRK